jgi:hypothetical protein
MKIDIDFVKGLVQSSSGEGFAINSKTSVSAAGDLDSTTFLTIATGAIAGGGLVLPSSATDGTIKLIVADTDADVLVKGTNATTGDITLTNKGDWILAVYDGSSWVVIRSLS